MQEVIFCGLKMVSRIGKAFPVAGNMLPHRDGSSDSFPLPPQIYARNGEKGLVPPRYGLS